MPTKSQLEAGLRVRSLKLNGPELLSSPRSLRPIYRYSGIKEVAGDELEFQADMAVYDEGKASERAIWLNTNKEPMAPDTTFRQAAEDWLRRNAAAHKIIAWRVVQDAGAGKRLVVEIDRETAAEAVTERWLIAEKPNGRIFRGKLTDGKSA